MKLVVNGLEAFYGRAQALFGVDLEVGAGEAVVLLGRNGAGKTTLLKSIMGLIRPAGGEIALDGRSIVGEAPHRICRLGVGFVPEDRRIFAKLTVAENLNVARLPPRAGASAWTEERIFASFPHLAGLRNRRGGEISGGEQQMLSIARALMGNPHLLLLDEPSEGLAPRIVADLVKTVLALKSEAISVLLAEQNLRFAQTVADRAYVIATGRIRTHAPIGELLAVGGAGTLLPL